MRRLLLVVLLAACGNTGAPLQNGVALADAFGGLRFTEPLLVLQEPGPTGRFLVVEKRGTIQAVGKSNTATPFLDHRAKVNSTPGEAGLLGLALSPGWPADPTAYVSYTAPSAQSPANLRSTLSRFTSRDGGATLDPSTETILLTVEQPFANHNGGHVVFGPDGYLYFGLGDGGDAGDPMGNAQNLGVLLGKLLRLDPATGKAPITNPFVNRPGARPEIYAYGLRNPWRFSFDRQTRKLWLGDVGQDAFEEIDNVEAGQNFGWNRKEGKSCYRSSTCAGDFTDPVVDYPHDQGLSVTAGFVYRGSDVPALQGRFVYGDFGSGRIWSLAADGPAQAQVLAQAANISSFGEDQRGELYVVDLAGAVSRFVPSSQAGALAKP
ncbi:MAG: PQQ-dependent sugar dehydrogenase [Myxococcales bacterium]